MSKDIFGAAEWIGGAERPLHAHTMSVFQLSYRLRLWEGSTSAGFLFGGNDVRLMDRNKNLQDVETNVNESYVALVLDTQPLEAGKPATFSAFRYGYCREDGNAPLHQAEIPLDVLNLENAHGTHTVQVRCVYGQIEVYIDGFLLTKGDQPFGGDVWNLNPVGAGNNFICFPLLCDIGIRLDAGQTADFSNLEIRNYREPCSLLYTAWENGCTFSGDNAGLLRLFDPSHGSMTSLRTAFHLEKPIQCATIVATARGIYELFLNGARVGQDWFAPGLSQYNKTHYYQEYDVTGLLHSGENQWSANLGEGWWSGAITFSGEKWNFFGDRQSLIAALTITYADGTAETIVTEPSSWQVSQDGPIQYSSFFQGETYDFRREGQESWLPAQAIPLSADNAFIGEMVLPPFGQRVSMDYDSLRFLPQPDRGVQVVKTLTAREMTQPRPGVYVYDMGQNLAGVPEITISGTDGQVITLRYAEILYPDMPEYRKQAGMLMLENIRGALSTDVAVLRNGIQTIRPHFTFHGYRYMEITGIDAPLPLEAVRGLALSSVDVTAEFSCSDPDITRLYQNICWSLRDNCISIPTDCPQRNERMGWSGDLSVFSETMVQMADCEQFLRRHLQALRDTQSAEGRFDDVAPVGGGFGGILWGSAGITVPWALYRQTGNEEILSEHFDAMVQYGRFLRSKLDEKGLVSEGPLGDWLGPENEKNEPQLLWQSYYVYDLEIILRCAEILNQPEIQKEFTPDRELARKAFHRWFLDPDTGRTVYSSESAARGEGGMGGPPRSGPSKELPPKTAAGQYLMDTQTSYAVPLALGVLYPAAAEQAKAHLGEAVRRTNRDDGGIERPPYSLMTGFIGTAWILSALSQGGMDRDAWRMLRNTGYPSWLYPVKQGATTIWERLDSFTLDHGFGGNNAMNSFNHYSFGAVGSWMLSHALGFEWNSTQGTMVLAPTLDPDGVVTWAEGSVVADGERYALRWEQDAQNITYRITVPAGHTALFRLPSDAPEQNIIHLKEGTSRFVVPRSSQQGECTQHRHAGKE